MSNIIKGGIRRSTSIEYWQFNKDADLVESFTSPINPSKKLPYEMKEHVKERTGYDIQRHQHVQIDDRFLFF